MRPESLLKASGSSVEAQYDSSLVYCPWYKDTTIDFPSYSPEPLRLHHGSNCTNDYFIHDRPRISSIYGGSTSYVQCMMVGAVGDAGHHETPPTWKFFPESPLCMGDLTLGTLDA